MRNVTVSLDDELARWVRIKAAEEDLSVSRFLSQILQERKEEAVAYELAMAANLAREPIALNKGGRYPSREEVHERPGLRR